MGATAVAATARLALLRLGRRTSALQPVPRPRRSPSPLAASVLSVFSRHAVLAGGGGGGAGAGAEQGQERGCWDRV